MLQVSHVHVLKFVPRTQQACFHNMPLAFATAAVNYYVALNVELGGLFYWWVPDNLWQEQTNLWQEWILGEMDFCRAVNWLKSHPDYAD